MINRQCNSNCLIIYFFSSLKRYWQFFLVCPFVQQTFIERQPGGAISGSWSPPDCLIPPHAGCVTRDKFLSLSEPLLPYMQNGMLRGPPHRVVVKMKGIGTLKVFRGWPGPHWAFHGREPLPDRAEVLEKELCLCCHGTYILCLVSDIIHSIFIKHKCLCLWQKIWRGQKHTQKGLLCTFLPSGFRDYSIA